MKRDPRLLRFVVAAIAVGLAIAYLVASFDVRKRVDDTFLTLLAASAVIALVPWDKLTSVTAGQFEFVWQRPEVAGVASVEVV